MNGTRFTKAGQLYEVIDLRFDELAAEGFQWPFTDVSDGDGRLDGTDWNQDSPLSRLGYSVAGTRDQVEARRKLLGEAFQNEIPCEPSETELWDKPKSAMRLHRIAVHIAALVRNAKRRTRPPYRAIERWESDLTWLKNKFYDGTAFSFRWPSYE